MNVCEFLDWKVSFDVKNVDNLASVNIFSIIAVKKLNWTMFESTFGLHLFSLFTVNGV